MHVWVYVYLKFLVEYGRVGLTRFSGHINLTLNFFFFLSDLCFCIFTYDYKHLTRKKCNICMTITTTNLTIVGCLHTI